MNTFLIIIGIIAFLVVFGAVFAGLTLSKFLAKGAVFVLRKGTEHALSRTEPEWVPSGVRAAISEINGEALALPEPGLFNAKSVLRTVKDLTLRLAAELEKLEAAAPAPEPTLEVVAALPPAADATAESAPAPAPAAEGDGTTAKP